MKYGISIAIFPTSWELTYKRIRSKDLIAFGPLRFCLHRVTGNLSEYTS